jgi:hypothetical protein
MSGGEEGGGEPSSGNAPDNNPHTAFAAHVLIFFLDRLSSPQRWKDVSSSNLKGKENLKIFFVGKLFCMHDLQAICKNYFSIIRNKYFLLYVLIFFSFSTALLPIQLHASRDSLVLPREDVVFA